MSYRRSSTLLLGLSITLAACDEERPAVPPTPCSAGHDPVAVILRTELRGQYLDSTPGNATWVAVQDGRCGWRPIVGDAGEYAFEVTDDRYAVAVVCADPSTPDRTTIRVDFRHIDDPRELRASCAAALPDEPAARLGLDAQDTLPYHVRLHIRDVTSLDNGYSAGAHSVLSVPARRGRYDIAVLGHDHDTDYHLTLRRDAPAIGDQLVTATRDDILGWPALGPEATAGLAEPAIDAGADYLTSLGTVIGLPDSSPDEFPSYRTLVFRTVPTSLVLPGDAYRVRAAYADGGGHYRIVESYLDAPPDVALEAPRPLGQVSVELTQDGEVTDLVAFTVDALPDAHLYSLSQQVESPTLTTLTVWSYTARWLGSDARHRVVLPSLAGAPGFDPAWEAGDLGGDWEARVLGNSEGWAGEALAAELGAREGVPAELVGMTRWMARALLEAPR